MRRALAALAAAVACAALAVPALGHTEVAATSPRDGARLAAAPARIVVTYASPLGAAREAVVRGPGPAAAGPARLDPGDARRLVIPLRSGAPGPYEASWTVLGADGHQLAGALAFTVRGDVLPEVERLGALIVATARRLSAAAASRP